LLKFKAFAAVLWSGGDIVLRQGMQFVATMVLARLLSPSDFGVVAMLALFIGVAYVLMDGGFSVALIQRRDISHLDESTVFWCNLGIGSLLTFLLFAAAPLIANFYDTPILVPLARTMSLSCLLASLGSIHGTLLTRKLDFKTQAKAGAIAALLSGTVAIVLALRGYGVWALVAQALVMAGAMSTLLWSFHPWRPSWVFSRSSLGRLFGFGGFHLASSLLEMAYAKLYTLLVGRLFGTRELGLYANADNTRLLPGNFLGGLVARVALPMFSEAAHDRALLRRGIQLSLRGMMLINAPVMLGMAALAEPAIAVLFGNQWLAAAPILRVLCIAGLLYPIHAINLHALMAQGHARLMFRLELLKKGIGVTLLVAGAYFGVMGVAWSQFAFSLLALALNTHYSAKLLGYGLAAQARDFLPPVVLALVMAAVVATLNYYWPWDSYAAVRLGVLVCTGAAFFVAGAAMLRLEALRDVLLLLQTRSSAHLGETGTL